ncbi:MAG: hypothetical protein QNK04_22045 [Myxococcota bacterium]|nr:hypothetical protein [Myxococcota bacterium]
MRLRHASPRQAPFVPVFLIPFFLVSCLSLALAAGPAFAGGDDDDDDDDDRGGKLRVGTCKRDITPIAPGIADAYEAAFGVPAEVNHTDPVWLAGFGNGRAATGYNDQLWARGLVLANRGTRVAIVSIDLIGYFKNEIDLARAMVSPKSRVDFVVVTSSHQHEGPDTLGIWGPDGTTSGIDFGYIDFVNESIAACIDEAAASLRPARVLYATTSSEGLSLGLDPEDDGFGVGDGKVLAGDEALAPETEGRIVDPLITSMQITRRSGRVLATLVNFASHPESLGSRNTLVTSDFPHYLRERIEAEYGGLAIWVSGDLGVLQGPLDIDVEDPATGMPAPRRTFDFARVHGTQLAERAIESIAAARISGRGDDDDDDDDDDGFDRGDKKARVGFSVVDPVDVRLDNPFFRFAFAIGVLDPRRSLYTDGEVDDSIGNLAPPADSLPAAAGEDLRTEVSALQVGKGAIAVVPGEVDPQIAFGYRDALVAQTGAEHTLIFGLGNDEIGYQLPAEKWDDSCHACASWIIVGAPQFCPVQPIDCNTVFRNNVGQEVDPTVSEAVSEAIDGL